MSAVLAATSMSKVTKRSPTASLGVTDRADTTRALTSAVVSLLPERFVWSEEETAKINSLAEELNCSPAVAGRLVVFLLVYVSAYQKEFSVAELPAILKSFPVKWGYKKKRHDFLHRLREMGFIYVQTDYWAKIRAKKYGIGKAGSRLLTRVLGAIFPPALSNQPAANRA